MVFRMAKSNDKKDKKIFKREIEEIKISVQQNDPIHIALILCGLNVVKSSFQSYLNSLILMSSSQVNLHLVTDGMLIKNYLQRIVSI